MLKKRTAEDTCRLIIDAAMELFANKGFRGTTTKKIAEKVGISEAAIFKYFATKKELYSAIIDRKVTEEPRFEFPTAAARRKDDLEVFGTIARFIIEKTERDRTFLRLFYFSALEGHELSDMFFETHVRQLYAFLSYYIMERIEDGAFRKVNPTLAARAFIGMVGNYVVVQELFGQKRRERFDRAEVIDTFLTIFLNGLKNKAETG